MADFMDNAALMRLAQKEADLFSVHLKLRLAAGANGTAVCLGAIGLASERLGCAAREGADPVGARAYLLDFVGVNFDDPSTQDPSVIAAVRDDGDGD